MHLNYIAIRQATQSLPASFLPDNIAFQNISKVYCYVRRRLPPLMLSNRIGSKLFQPYKMMCRIQKSVEYCVNFCSQSYAVLPCAAGVRGGGTGRRFFTPHPPAARSQRSCARPPRRAQFRPRPFAALKFIPCAGRICAYSRCAAAASASAQSVRSQGRSRSARPKWP